MDFVDTHVAGNFAFYDEEDFHRTMGRVFVGTTTRIQYLLRASKSLEDIAARIQKKPKKKIINAGVISTPKKAAPLVPSPASSGAKEPLPCPICFKEASTATTLKRHMCEHFRYELLAKLDPAQKKVCPLCQKELASPTANLNHLISVHDALFDVMPEETCEEVRVLVDGMARTRRNMLDETVFEQ